MITALTEAAPMEILFGCHGFRSTLNLSVDAASWELFAHTRKVGVNEEIQMVTQMVTPNVQI